MKASKKSKSSTEASLSQTRAELKEMIVEENYKIVENIKEVRTPMNLVWQILVQAKLLNATEKTEENIDNFYDFHTIYDHTLQTCKEFHTLV